MTDRASIKTKRYRSIRLSLPAFVIALATLVSAMIVITSSNGISIKGQTMEGGHDGSENMNTSLTQAMSIAEQSVDNNTFAVAAFDNIVSNDSFAVAALGENRAKDLAGSLVHSIILDTPGTEFYHVIVDPGNGQILATQKLSQKALENMHLEHSRKVLVEPHLMNNTFVH